MTNERARAASPHRVDAVPVVVVGSVNLDYVIRIADRPEPGETVTGGVFETHAGGKGANQALTAARCGAAVELVARVGDDAAGAERVAELKAAGVGTSHVWTTPGVATGAAFITLTPDAQNAIMLAPGANERLRHSDVEAASALIAAATVLVAQLEVPVSTVARAVELAGPNPTIVLNCAPFRRLPAEVLSRVDVLVANEHEAAGLCGSEVGDPDEARRAARTIRAMGPAAVVITLGPLGAVVVGPDLEAVVPAPAVDPVDTTGAGDAFVGALAACLAVGVALVDAVRFGVAVGSATTEQEGALARLPGPLRRRYEELSRRPWSLGPASSTDPG